MNKPVYDFEIDISGLLCPMFILSLKKTNDLEECEWRNSSSVFGFWPLLDEVSALLSGPFEHCAASCNAEKCRCPQSAVDCEANPSENLECVVGASNLIE